MKPKDRLKMSFLVLIFAGCSGDSGDATETERKRESPFQAQTDALQQAKQVEQMLQDGAKQRQQQIERQMAEQ